MELSLAAVSEAAGEAIGISGAEEGVLSWMTEIVFECEVGRRIIDGKKNPKMTGIESVEQTGERIEGLIRGKKIENPVESIGSVMSNVGNETNHHIEWRAAIRPGHRLHQRSHLLHRLEIHIPQMQIDPF